MKRFIGSVLLLIIVNRGLTAQITIKSDDLQLTVSEKGQVTAMQNGISEKNYLATKVDAPLLKIRIDTNWVEPVRAVFNRQKSVITLAFPGNITAEIKADQKKDHVAFHLIGLSDKGKVNAIYWGPYPLTINKTISEVVGIVHDGEFAIGMQTLNAKTIGAVLKSEGGTDDSRGSAATAQPWGSSLQAYSLDRSHLRIVNVWGNQYPEMPVKAIPAETVRGSAIALFGCRESEVLDRIGSIEIAWNLPHPLINGVWHKKSSETGRAYLISDFTEDNIDEMLEYTKRAGLISLYHEGPFSSWGHYILDSSSFPHGIDGMRKCVEKASAMGLRIGVHTLSTFINTNDPYVTPVPDKRLAQTGSSILKDDIDNSSTQIAIQSKKYFDNIKPSTLHAVKIDDEIIRFRQVSPDPPFRLLDCSRGAFGTQPAGHKKGETIAMLMDYPYQTLFPDFELQQEIASNLARFFNETGVSQLDFDGHEGCMSSGEGEYAIQAFADKVYRETDHTLVNGTSRSSHYYWHICHYWNWGEPWYGGFRESQGDYRLDNQPFLERNYMPNMLGWFLLSPTTGQEDIEWMMARAAGYKAGFALVARYNSLKNNPDAGLLLDLINLWQEAWRSGMFTPEQISRLKDPANDFHLSRDAEGWKLYPFRKHQFDHMPKLLKPGQPAFSEWQFENNDPEQPLTFTVTFSGKEGQVRNPWIELDSNFRLEMPGTFETGSSIVCDGNKLKLYNTKGKFVNELTVNQSIPTLNKGKHSIRFDCTFPEESDLKCRIIIKTMEAPETLKI